MSCVKYFRGTIFYLSICLVFSSPVFSIPTWIIIDSSYPEGSPPLIHIEDYTNDYTIYTVKIPGFYCENVFEGGQVFQKIWVPAYGTKMEVGKPELPVVRGLMGYPPMKDSSTIQVLDSEWVDFENYLMYPHQLSRPLEEQQPLFECDQSFYNQDIWYPGDYVCLSDEGKFRDVIVVNNQIQSFQYNPLYRHLRVASNMEIRVDYGLSVKENKKFFNNMVVSGIESHPDFLPLYNSLIWNSNQLNLSPLQSEVDYLIITGNSYYDELAPLVKLLTDRGYSVDRVKMSELPEGTSALSVYHYIKYRYEQSNIAYVLLVGDVQDNWGQEKFNPDTMVPTPYWIFCNDTDAGIGKPYFSPSDLCYACLDNYDPPIMSIPPSQRWRFWWEGFDMYPDIYVGRLTADNIEQVNVQVSKINTYERHLDNVNNPDSSPWYDTMLFIAHNGLQDNDEFRIEKEQVWNGSYDISFKDNVKFLYGRIDDDNNDNDAVISVINQGCNIVNYFGHGYPSKWLEWAVHADNWGLKSFLGNPHIINLQNEHYLVAFNIGCSMACIDWHHGYEPTGDTLCDYWMILPSSQSPPYHGAVATIGATRTTFGDVNFVYDRAIFQTMFGLPGDGDSYVKPFNKLGGVTYGAITRSFIILNDQNSWLPNILSKLYIYILLGEPSMEIRNYWTENGGGRIGITLTSFTAKPNNNAITLNWSVSTDEDISGFNLYRRTTPPEAIHELPLQYPPVGTACPAEQARDYNLSSNLTTVSEDTYPRMNDNTQWTKVSASLITGTNPYSYTDKNVESERQYEYKLEAVVSDRQETLGTTKVTSGNETPSSFEISRIYPTPASSQISIDVMIPSQVDIDISIYDITGRKVSTVIRGQYNSGEYTLTSDISGLTNGLYIVRMTTEGLSASKNFVIVK